MARLSEEHPDGWGVASWEPDHRWTVRRGLLRAGEDLAFHELADSLVGELVIVHVRQKTHGPTTMENTHPFVAGQWAFAHNGKIADIGFLEASLSLERRARLRGDTDSERLFGYILTRFDQAGIEADTGPHRIAARLRTIADELRAHPGLGTASFLLSNGDALFAYRQGAPLHLLRRHAPQDSCRDCLGSPCVAVTTEPLTDDPWLPLEDGDLVRLSPTPLPAWVRV